MILRRVIADVRKQEWTAIWIDLFIVIVGVFIGIQVSNWNGARAFDGLERSHLRNLRAEIEQDIRATAANRAFYMGVSRAGERVLTFLEQEKPCTAGCWSLLVDLFHASQWIGVGVTQTTYAEMRRNGLPRDRRVASAIEDYYLLNVAIDSGANERPAYRTLVRGLIPVRAQQAMWTGCHERVGAIVTFDNDCPSAIPPLQAARAVEAIRADPNIRRTLTQWTATSAGIVKNLGGQNDEARKAIAAIDRELGTPP